MKKKNLTDNKKKALSLPRIEKHWYLISQTRIPSDQ
jgi:hypothetical protein